MYRIGHKLLKLDGVITEFADIYAPLAQMFMNEPDCPANTTQPALPKKRFARD